MTRRDKTTQNDEHKNAARLPFGLVFNISTLAASLSVLFSIATGESDLFHLSLRATLVFIGFAVAGSLIMIVSITMIHRIRREEFLEKARLAEEERMAAALTMQHNPQQQQLHHSQETANNS
ncbi:MAG: hypothetical protein N2663_03185 [Chlorobi bacterium]|nr:hypothetical protein [Chlorobiota bacterium]